MRKFAVFILTHGRADKVITYKTLRDDGYTGPVYFVVDNMDDQVDQYRENFGQKNVIVFDKPAQAAKCDTMDNFEKMNVILFARNVCFELAEQLGLTHFLELDDDYTSFAMRYIKDGIFTSRNCYDLDTLFDWMCDCLDETGALTIALAQGGDFAGGAEGKNYQKRVLRKAMNSFFCRTDRQFRFLGRINEDVNTYTLMGSQGAKIFTVTEASLTQLQTQSNSGGMTETYLDSGTYLKSFYTVVAMPSAAKINMMSGGSTGHRHYRIHHNVCWNNCVPKILDEKHKKV